MTVQYDPAHGILYSALRLKSTVVSQVLYRAEFYLLFAFHGAVSAAYKLKYFDPDRIHLELTMNMTGVTGSLMTFFVVFYNGNVFARYNKLYELTKQMNEFCLYTTAIFGREISCKNTVRKLSRMLLASSLLFFYERSTPPSEHEDAHNISKQEWMQIESMGLVDQYERDLLEAHCRALGSSAIPSFLLLQWSMRLYRSQSEKGARIAELEKAYWRIRNCQEEVVEILDLPMPFQYFHIMNLMLMLNLALWAYAFALMDSHLATIIYLAIQLVFQGIRELSIAMSDPFGSDDADFPLNTWVNMLYVRIVSTVEDTWSVETFKPNRNLGPLPVPGPNEWVLDLLVDNQGAIDVERVFLSDNLRATRADIGGLLNAEIESVRSARHSVHSHSNRHNMRPGGAPTTCVSPAHSGPTMQQSTRRGISHSGRVENEDEHLDDEEDEEDDDDAD